MSDEMQDPAPDAPRFIQLGRVIDGEPSWYEEQIIAALAGLDLDRFRVVVDTALAQMELAMYLDEMGYAGGGSPTDEQKWQHLGLLRTARALGKSSGLSIGSPRSGRCAGRIP